MENIYCELLFYILVVRSDNGVTGENKRVFYLANHVNHQIEKK